jgi:hypothetical protein
VTTDLIQEAVLDWARNAFAHEIREDFARATSFDGMLSQIVVAPLKRFAPQDLNILAEVLPLGVASTGPSSTALRNQLPPEQRKIVEQFQEMTYTVRSERWAEYSQDIQKVTSESAREEARSIVHVATGEIGTIASQWGFKCVKIDRSTWKLTSLKEWGELSVQFDLGSPLRLHYGIFIYDRTGNQVRRHDHYLGLLGIGPSEWAIENARECPDRLRKAGEFIRWHVSEYERILQPVFGG